VHAYFESVVKPLRGLAESHQLGHRATQSLRTDIDRVIEVATRGRELLGRTFGFFACDAVGLYEEVELPRRVRPRALVDATPYLRPLFAVLDEFRRACVVVLSRKQAWFYELFMGQLREARKVKGRSPRKPDFGGWHGYDEHHVRNRAEQLVHRHLSRVAEQAETLMTESSAELLMLGGHQESVTDLLPHLPKALRAKVAGTFVIDPSTLTEAQVLEHAQPILERYEREEEASLVAEALDRVGARGLGAVGLEWCLLAADEQGIELLLIDDEKQVPGRMCDNCGWLGLAGDPCPVCAHPTRETPDVIDDMCEAVVAAGGRVIGAETDTAPAPEMVAARLRFPVPRPVATGSG
jgi:peptide chain release factor subunit 1